MNKGLNFINNYDIYDKSILNKIDYRILCLSHRPHLAVQAVENIKHLNTDIVLKEMIPFSAILNSSIFQSNAEFNIILNDKTRPEENHIVKILNLLNLGYGLAGLSFHLFGLSKELFRKIGHWDEKFIPGEYEDCDFLIRMHEANIAWYHTQESKDYVNIVSSFSGSDLPRERFLKKWGLENSDDLSKYKRLEQEEKKYDFGESKNLKFLDSSFTIESLQGGFKNI
jgi:hypothetical protein